MVNSGSLSSEGDRNVNKASFIQANSTSSINPQSPSPITASGAIQARNTSATDGSYLPSEVRAIEPTPTKTDFGLGSTSLASLFGGKPNNLCKLREQDSGSGQQKTGLFCSLPLDKVQTILKTYQLKSKILFTSGITSKTDTAPTELANGGGIKAKSPRKILCLYCERTFANANLRQKHVERCHSTKQFRRVSSRRNQSIPCVFNNCDKLTTTTEHTLKELFEHLVLNHSNKYYGCLSCEERFLNASHLDDHNASTHRVFPEIERESRRDEEVVVTTRVAEAQIETPSSPPQQKVTRSQLRTRTGNSSAIEIATMKTGRRKKKDTTTVQGYHPANSPGKGLIKTKKLLVKSSRIVLKRSTRLQAKILESQKKKRQQKKKKQTIKKVGKSSHVAIGAKLTDKSAKNSGSSSASSTSVVNPYPEFDSLYRVKKITDHSIDNLKISSLTFDDVFDKAFFNRIKCNIQENLLHHIDGKIFENEESENRISNFEKISNTPQEVQQATENYGCELTLNAVTPAPSALLTSSSAQFGEDLESQIEYGSKPSQNKKRAQQQTRSTGTGTGNEEAIVHYKYFTRRKYQASILEHKENRDLSKLDMWTQYVVKTRQQKILDEQKSPKELSDYQGGAEYVSRIKREELNRILDRRGPFEDLKEEASKKAVLDKLWGSERAPGDYVVSEQDFSEVRQLINDLLNRVVEICENVPQPSTSRMLLDHQPFVVLSPLAADHYDPVAAEIPSYLNLRRTCTLSCDEVIDRSDKIALICSSQETENFELPTNKIRDKNEKVELTGEWARSRIFVCAACGLKFQNCKQLMEHKNLHHQNVWVQHYELVGNQSELYRHLSIPGLGKVGLIEDTVQCRQWKRSDARKCSKCEKQCNSLGELHRHILECGGDWTWMLARKKYKYRPFGAKSRRKRRGLVKRRIFTQKTQPTEKKIYKKTFDGPRPKPSDADTIQRMLANLPPKRATRKIMCLKDGLSRPRNKPQQQNQSPKMQNKMKCGKLIHRVMKEKTNTSEQSNSPKIASSSKNNKNNARNGYRKSLRNLNKVLASRILDTNSALLLKRKFKRNAAATPKHIEDVIEDVISESVVDQELDEKTKSPPKKKTAVKTVHKITEDDLGTTQSANAEKEIAKSKRTSPRIDNKNKESSSIPPAQSQPTVTKTVAERMNIKRFFSVKKKNNSSQNVSNNEESQKQTTKRKLLDSKRTAISLPENLEQIAMDNENKIAGKKCGKKRETISSLVRTLSLRAKKRNTETVMMAKVSTNKPVEDVIANSKKRKLKNGVKRVVKQIKKIVSTEPQQTTNNNEQPAGDKCLTSSSTDQKDVESVDNTRTCQPGDFLDKELVPERNEIVQEPASELEKPVIPAAAALSPEKSDGNVADPPVPTQIVDSCSTNENSATLGTIFDMQSKNEHIFESNSALNIDHNTAAKAVAAPSVSVSKEPECETVQNSKASINPPALQKGRMRTKKLNDCIAMLTDKLNKSLENIATPNTSLNIVTETKNRSFDCESTKTEDPEFCGALNLVVDKNKNQSLNLSRTKETESRQESYILKVPLINNYFTQKKTEPKLDFPVDLQIRHSVDGSRKPENRAFEQLENCKSANNDKIMYNPMQNKSIFCDNKIAPFEKVVYEKQFSLKAAHSSNNARSQTQCYTERNLAFSEEVSLVEATDPCQMSHNDEKRANESMELNLDICAKNQIAIVAADNRKLNMTTKPKRRSRSAKTSRKIPLSDSIPEFVPEQDQNAAIICMPTNSKQSDNTAISMETDIRQSEPAIVAVESDDQQNGEPLNASLATIDKQNDASTVTLETSELTDLSPQMIQNKEKHINESTTHNSEKHANDSMENNLDVGSENQVATVVADNRKSKKASKPKKRSRSAKTSREILLSNCVPEIVPEQEQKEAIISTSASSKQSELAIISMESGKQQNVAPLVVSSGPTDKQKDANTVSLETTATIDLSSRITNISEKGSNGNVENNSDVCAENKVATVTVDNRKPKKTFKPKGRSRSAKTIREIPLSNGIPEIVPEPDQNAAIISVPVSSKQGESEIVFLGAVDKQKDVNIVSSETSGTTKICQMAHSSEKPSNASMTVNLDKCAENQVATVLTDSGKSKKTSKPKRRSRSAKCSREIPVSDGISNFGLEHDQNAAIISMPTISKQKSMMVVPMETDNKESKLSVVFTEPGNHQNDTPMIFSPQTAGKQMDVNAVSLETSSKQHPVVIDNQNVLETNIDDALKLIEIAVNPTATKILSQDDAVKKINSVYSDMQEEPHILEKTYLIPNKSVENKEKLSDSEDEVPLSALVKLKEIENVNIVEDRVVTQTVKSTLANKPDKPIEISDLVAKTNDSCMPETNDESNDNSKTDFSTCSANVVDKSRATKKQKRRSRSRKKSLNGKISHLTISDILDSACLAPNLDESDQTETKKIVSEESSTIVCEPSDNNDSVDISDSAEKSENVTISADTTVKEIANSSQEISRTLPEEAGNETTVSIIAKARRNKKRPSGSIGKKKKAQIQVSVKTIEQVAEVLLNESETTLPMSESRQTTDENQDFNASEQEVQTGLEVSSMPDKQETPKRKSMSKFPELIDQNEVAEILHPVTKNGEIKENDLNDDVIAAAPEESNVRRRSNRTAKSKALESILDDALAELTESERNREVFKSVLVNDNIVIKSTKKKKKSLERKKSNSKDRENSSDFDLIRENLCKVLLKEKRREVFSNVEEDEDDDLGTNDSTQCASQIEKDKEETSVHIATDLPPYVHKTAALTPFDLAQLTSEIDSTHVIIDNEIPKESLGDGVVSVDTVITEKVTYADVEQTKTPAEQEKATFDSLDTVKPTTSGSVLQVAEPTLNCTVPSSNLTSVTETLAALQTEPPVSETVPSGEEIHCSVASKLVDIELAEPEVEQYPSEISNDDTTELVNDGNAGKELRRSRRSSRKITSYNENELMNDPVLDDLPKPTTRGQKEKGSKKVATNANQPELDKFSVEDLEQTDNVASSLEQKDTDPKNSEEVLSEVVPNAEHCSFTLVDNDNVCEKDAPCNEPTVAELDVLENSNASGKVLAESVSEINKTDLLAVSLLNESGTKTTQDIPEESVFLSPVRKKARRAPRKGRNSRKGSKKRVPVTLEYSEKHSQKETANSTQQKTEQNKSTDHLKKLTSDELFDLLKTTSANDSNEVESMPVATNNTFLQNFDEISSDSRDDNFDILGEPLVDDDVDENSSEKSFAPLEITETEINNSSQNDTSVEETEPDATNNDLSCENMNSTAEIEKGLENDEVTKMRPLKRTRSFNNRQTKTQEALLGEEIENQLADISSAVSNTDNSIAGKISDVPAELGSVESSVEQVQPPVLLLSNKNNKKSNKREYKPGYCEICNKSFQRPDSLVKHKRTISHISKLSEIEAREAEQLKSQTADAEPSNENSRPHSTDVTEITSTDSLSKTLEPLADGPVESELVLTTKTPEPLPPPLPQNEDSRSSDVVEITSDSSNKNDINLFDMLQHSNRADANRSPFSIHMDNAGLKLAHIIVGTSLINDVLNKPAALSKDSVSAENNEPPQLFSQQSPPEFRRYKSLGERKSFEAENPSHQIPATNDNNMQPVQPAMDYFEPQLSQTAGTILEKQISLLQNIIENRSGVKYIDDISISSGGPSINNDNDDNCSDMSLEEDIPKSDDCCRIYTSTEQVLTNVNTLKSVAVAVPLEEDRGFLKPPPTQYEEISEDSSNLRNYDDQKSRKVLNRDEELFLECCSLLKSGSEVSSYSKKSQTLSKVLNNLDLKPSEEPSWLENKALPRHTKDFVSIEDYSDDGSRIPTPLGDNFVDDQSNSNTISSNWDTSKLNNADDVVVVHDKAEENSRLVPAADLTPFENRSFVFDKDQLQDDSEENLVGLDCEKESEIQDNVDEDDDVFDDDPPEFGPQHIAEGGIIIRTKSVSEESSISSHHEAEADANSRKKSEDLSDASTTDSRKMLTKGAMKVFEGLKVSIPTEDLNMAEVLNGSGILKPSNTTVDVQEKCKSPTPDPVVAATTPAVSPAVTPKKLIKHKFSRGKLELGSKFLFKIKRKPTARALRRKKQTGSNKMTSRTHDIYDFEETQDNSDVFTKPDFRSFRCSKKSNEAKKTESSRLVDSDNDSQDGAGGNNSTGFEAASSSASSVSDIPNKKPRTAQQTSTKKKCMIMGRIFKNAIKSRVEDEIRDIPVIDHTELVENFVMSCPDSLSDQNTVVSKKPTVMTEEEMNVAFDKLVGSDVVLAEDKNTSELMKKPATPTFTKPQNNHKTMLSSGRRRTSKIKPRKRARANSDSTDDEFSLTSKKRNYRKNSKTEDNSINLEQELRECMGVASRKSQRKCTSGKQNVLVEYWSSDESNFEAMLESQILPQSTTSATKKHDNNDDMGATAQTTKARPLNNGETSKTDTANEEKQQEEQKLVEKEQPITTSQSSEDHIKKPTESRKRKPTKVRRLKSPTNNAACTAEDNQPTSKKDLATTGERSSSPATVSPTSMLNRRKRAAPNPLYHWSSSSEDESCDLIEIKPIRDELEDDEDRPIQHGWIVGDSPKKLVTMLAQAKGKKCDGEGVKEQGGKKRNSTSGGGNHNAFS